ncbi:MAG: histidine phosphatase family protein [Acidobacteriota bacterium]
MARENKNPQKWPNVIWLVRHGESAGNIARDQAEAQGDLYINLAHREIDVPLSQLGERQAIALGKWFATLPDKQKPTVILTSPYLRARETTNLVLANSSIDIKDISFVIDERLREKEFGIFDRLTKNGAHQLYPEQAETRTLLGKFYYRPPGGESWCDVILRLRSVIDTITREYRRERVLIVAHQVIVNCFRYLFERLSEEQILADDRKEDIANCSVTAYEFDRTLGKKGKLALRLYNSISHLKEAGEPVTTKKDIPIAPK